MRFCSSCGFPLADVNSAAPATAVVPPPHLPLLREDPRPQGGSLVLALVAASLVTLLLFVVFVAIEALAITGGHHAGSGKIAAIVIIGVLGLFGSVFLQAGLTVSFIRKWTGFTIGYGTEVWIILVATVAELITGFLGPLAIGVAVFVQWWLTRDRATPLSAVGAGAASR